jgi:hypothetical protein
MTEAIIMFHREQTICDIEAFLRDNRDKLSKFDFDTKTKELETLKKQLASNQFETSPSRGQLYAVSVGGLHASIGVPNDTAEVQNSPAKELI